MRVRREPIFKDSILKIADAPKEVGADHGGKERDMDISLGVPPLPA